MNILTKVLFTILTVTSLNSVAESLPAKLFHNTATVTIKAGQEERYTKAVTQFQIMKKTRAEKGNISYIAYQDTQNKNTVIFNELWKDGASVGAHLQSSHMAAFFNAINFNPALYDIVVAGNVTTFTLKDSNTDSAIQKLILDGFEAVVLK